VVIVYPINLVIFGLMTTELNLKINKVFFSFFNYSYTAPTALSIKQKVEQIRADVFY